MAELYLSTESETNFLTRDISAHPGEFVSYDTDLLIFEGDDGWVFKFSGDFDPVNLDVNGPGYLVDKVDDLEVFDQFGNLQYKVTNSSFWPMEFNLFMNESPKPTSFLLNNVLKGYDRIIGTHLNEKFKDSDGDDYYDLGGGTDGVVYDSYDLNNADIHFDSETGRILVTRDNVFERETDTLVNVEQLLQETYNGFEVFAFDFYGISGKAYRMYQAAFGRTPDEPGLGYWVDQMQKGLSIEEMAIGFINSVEFKELFGSDQSDDSFVASIYENVLGRAPDQAGLNWWVEQLENGNYNRSSVLVGFCESPENVELVMPDIENGIHYDLWMG